MRGAGEGLVMRGVRKVFSELDADDRMSPGGWPGWKEQKAGRRSQNGKRKDAECVHTENCVFSSNLPPRFCPKTPVCHEAMVLCLLDLLNTWKIVGSQEHLLDSILNQLKWEKPPPLFWAR